MVRDTTKSEHNQGIAIYPWMGLKLAWLHKKGKSYEICWYAGLYINRTVAGYAGLYILYCCTWLSRLLEIELPFVAMFACLCALCLFVCLFVCVLACLFVCLPVCFCVCLSVCVFVCLFAKRKDWDICAVTPRSETQMPSKGNPCLGRVTVFVFVFFIYHQYEMEHFVLSWFAKEEEYWGWGCWLLMKGFLASINRADQTVEGSPWNQALSLDLCFKCNVL